MRRQIKRVIDPIFQAWFRWYMRKPRPFRFGKIRIMVHPEVFPPFFTISTRILLKYINALELKGKSFLELGCGSGIVSLLAASKGALVTATDINQKALEMLEMNMDNNRIGLELHHSDLFQALPGRQFDYIIINPPYYPRNPKNIAENAWFCGENFEYFQNLFSQLPVYLSEQNQTVMILSEDCELDKIQQIAAENNLIFQESWTGKVRVENNYIFSIKNKKV